jgi:hypothetical protein
MEVPKAYIVKELQKVISFVCKNHVVVGPKEKKLVLYDKHFYHYYHGVTTFQGKDDPTKLPFVKQCVSGQKIFGIFGKIPVC